MWGLGLNHPKFCCITNPKNEVSRGLTWCMLQDETIIFLLFTELYLENTSCMQGREINKLWPIQHFLHFLWIIALDKKKAFKINSSFTLNVIRDQFTNLSSRDYFTVQKVPHPLPAYICIQIHTLYSIWLICISILMYTTLWRVGAFAKVCNQSDVGCGLLPWLPQQVNVHF